LDAGEVDAACMIDGNRLTFTREGTLPAGTVVLARTEPYDHCNMTVVPEGTPAGVLDRFAQLLRSMSYDDASVRPLLDLEGLKRWQPGRLCGYEQLERAVDAFDFYDQAGTITADAYRP
jgi:ABC-type phosphate/phosphonate transport system substrate-binding protein